MTRHFHAKALIVVIALFIFSLIMPAKPLLLKKPDLVILSIFVDKDCNLAVMVKNMGPGFLPDAVYTDHHPKSAGVYVHIDGKKWGGESIWKFDPGRKLQKPGGATACTLNYKVTGPVDVKAIVDMFDDIKEVNENNNTLGKEGLDCKPGIHLGTGGIGGIGTRHPMGKYSITDIRFTPASPASLAFNDRVEVRFNYESSQECYIFARPMTNGSPTPHYAAHPSKLYPKGNGPGDGYFTITQGNVTVDQVRFQITDKAQKVLYEKLEPVKFSFPKTLTYQPVGPVIGTPLPARAPKQFMLEFNDAYLVFSPADKGLQIAAQSAVLSYGGDWEKCQLKPFLYQLRQNFWQGFFWQINTSKKEVYEVTGGTFCQMGGNHKKLNITVDVVGGSDTVPPDRFFLRFPDARLVYLITPKTLQVIAGDKVLSYGQDWEKCNLSATVIHLQQNVWKGFYWKVDTLQKKAWKINGTVCQPDSGGSELNVGVKTFD